MSDVVVVKEVDDYADKLIAIKRSVRNVEVYLLAGSIEAAAVHARMLCDEAHKLRCWFNAREMRK